MTGFLFIYLFMNGLFMFKYEFEIHKWILLFRVNNVLFSDPARKTRPSGRTHFIYIFI